MKVEDPSGQAWRISRRWVPWRRVKWGEVRPGGDPGGLGAWMPDDPLGLVLVAGVLVLAVLAPVFLLPVVVLVELLLLLLLMPFAVAGRVLLGRRWCVELRRGWSPWTELPAGDWQASTALIHEVAEAVRRGDVPVRSL